MLTRITPIINGYAVVIAQEEAGDGKPGALIGVFLQTPASPDDGPMILLGEAMAAYFDHVGPVGESPSSQPVVSDRVTHCQLVK